MNDLTFPLSDVLFGRNLTNIPEGSGVYVARYSGITLYVGRANRVRRRLINHGCGGGKLWGLAFHPVAEVAEIEVIPCSIGRSITLERELIKLRAPLLNDPSEKTHDVRMRNLQAWGSACEDNYWYDPLDEFMPAREYLTKEGEYLTRLSARMGVVAHIEDCVREVPVVGWDAVARLLTSRGVLNRQWTGLGVRSYWRRATGDELLLSTERRRRKDDLERVIRRHVDHGATYAVIAGQLNMDGVLSNNGKTWTARRVSNFMADLRRSS